VHQSPRERHQDDDVCPSDSTAGFRGGGSSPASQGVCCEARNHAQNEPACPSPPCAAPEVHHSGGKATDNGECTASATAALGFWKRRLDGVRHGIGRRAG
jgi:hypothetical protein